MVCDSSLFNNPDSVLFTMLLLLIAPSWLPGGDDTLRGGSGGYLILPVVFNHLDKLTDPASAAGVSIHQYLRRV